MKETSSPKNTQPLVFISYNRKDIATTVVLKDALQEAGYAPFIDLDNLSLKESWMDGLESVITNCDCAVVCFGKHGLGNIQRQEVHALVNRAAKDQDLLLITLILPAADPSTIPSLLNNYHCMDFSDGLHLDRLLELLENPDGGRNLASLVAETNSPDYSAATSSPISQYRKIPRSDPAPFYVGFPKPKHLVGHQDNLRKLHELMMKRGNLAVTASLAGQGGIGKTQLAVAYAYEYKDEACYRDGIFWLNAISPESIAGQFAAYAQQLRIPETGAGSNREQQCLRFLGWLRDHPDSLLVLDNVTETDFLQRSLPDIPNFRLDSLPCRLLITSRRIDIHNVENIQIDVLPPEAARTLLLKESGAASGDVNIREVDLLCMLLGYLPLALRLAGALMHYNNLSALQLADLLRDSGFIATLDDRESIAGETWQLSDYDAALTVVLETSWKAVPKKAEVARELMQIAGLMPVNTILPVDFVAPLAIDAKTSEPSSAITPFLDVLSRLSLIEMLDEKQAIRLHPLIHDFACKKSTVKVAHKAIENGLSFWTDYLFLVNVKPKRWKRLANEMILLNALAHAEETISMNLRKINRVFSHYDQNESGEADNEAIDKLLLQAHYQSMRLNLNVFANNLGRILDQKKGGWLKTRWTTDEDDPAELAIISVNGTIIDCCLSPNGDASVAIKEQNDEFILLHWHINQGVRRFAFDSDDKTAAAQPEQIAYSPDGTRFVVLFHDYSVQLWDARSIKLLREIRPDNSRFLTVSRDLVWSVALSESGNQICVANHTGQILLYDFDRGAVLSQTAVDDMPTVIHFDHENATAWFVTFDLYDTEDSRHRLCCWHWQGNQLNEVAAFKEQVTCLAATGGRSDSTRFLLYLRDEHSMGRKIVEYHTGKNVISPVRQDVYSDRATHMASSLDGNYVLMSDGTGSYLLLENHSVQPDGMINDISGTSVTCELDRTGATALTCSSHDVVKLWDLQQAKPFSATGTGALVCFGLGLVDKELWVVSSEGLVLRLDSESGKLLSESALSDSIGILNDIQFNPQGCAMGTDDIGNLYRFDSQIKQWEMFLQSEEETELYQPLDDVDWDDEEGDVDYIDGADSWFLTFRLAETRVALLQSGGVLQVMDTQSKEVVAVLKDQVCDGDCKLAISGNGEVLLVEASSTPVMIWHHASDTKFPLEISEDVVWAGVSCLSIDYSGELGAIGDMRGMLWLLDLKENRLLQQVQLGDYPLKQIEISDKTMIVVDDGDQIIISEVCADGVLNEKALTTLPDVEQVIFGQNDNEFLARTYGGALICFHLQ